NKGNSALFIDNNFEIKKISEKDKFLIKLIDLKTKDENILATFDNIEDQEKIFVRIILAAYNKENYVELMIIDKKKEKGI
ncbi:hypothetical protein, partial [Spiroplasma phoeniceum]|uniref:hypothetical protein n=1 Tax=Spiroplasma phoeniceum TaxID=47835 RepID=UPI003364EAC2